MKNAVKKLFSLLFTLIAVSFFTFLAFELISGDPAQTLLGTESSPERLAALRAELGLDQPFILRFLNWLGGFFTGNLGVSFSYRQPVWALLAPKLTVTVVMTLLSFLLITAVSIPLGIFSARWNNKVYVGVRTAFNQLCMAFPPFVLGIIFSWVFGITLKIFVSGDFPSLGDNFFGAVKYLFFAALSLSIPRIAMTVRMLRSSITDEMTKDYVRTSLSRGSTKPSVLRNHVLKNSLPGVVAFLAQTMAEIIGSGIVVEQVFGIPGIGRLLVSSIGNRDYPVVQAIVVILAAFVMLSGALADLINRRIDPRRRGGTVK